MSEPNCQILYVADPAASATFYGGLFGEPPTESSPNFAMFRLASGSMLGLWASHDVQPSATRPGGSELGFTVTDDREVDERHAAWVALGLRIEQAPTTMDFGRTFVALDPDGHRLRVFAPGR